MQVSSHYSASSLTTESIKLLNLTVLTNVSDISLCFQLVFPWLLMMLSNFTCSYCPFVYLLSVYSDLFFLFVWFLNCREFFKYSGYKHFVRCTYFKYFLSICDLHFCILSVQFWWTEVFGFEVQFVNISFCGCAFVSPF